MENVAYLLFFISIIGIMFLLATLIFGGHLEYNSGLSMKITIILALSYLAFKSYLWIKQIKEDE